MWSGWQNITHYDLFWFLYFSRSFDKLLLIWWSTLYCCITASGSKSHQLLAAWRKGGNHQTSHKMRARPHYYGCSLKDEGAPPLFEGDPHYYGCSLKDEGAPPLFEGAPPLLWVLSITNKHSSTSPNPPSSYLPATSADHPLPPHT